MIGNRAVFIIFGSFFSLISGFLILAAIMVKSAPNSETYALLSLAVMSFSLSYLYPQFIQKDERTRMIREKAMFFSSFSFLFYAFVVTSALRFNLIHLSAIEAINILISLMISTIFISMVVLARKY
ncbi:permease [Planococcus antarcticus DSM 14505]|uniref:Permease n=1 Tax=Planococcus antarcticus DSM 14505 TaxID=1185653 RepID=A0ABN4RM20_9BACL|nr:permease [Planococcus antarcticus DSM 14505]